MNNKLKACPFCGNEIKTFTLEYVEGGTAVKSLQAECENCYAEFRINAPVFKYGNEKIAADDAVKIWNHREPAPEGTWQYSGEKEGRPVYSCPKCGDSEYERTPFCPGCGARLENNDE